MKLNLRNRKVSQSDRNRARLSVMQLESRIVPSNAFDTLGLNGINAAGLGLTGNNIKIGQVEGSRPGDPNVDTMNANKRGEIDPTQVWYTDRNPTVDNVQEIRRTGDHSANVASIMIGDWPGTYTGIAPNANLYASAIDNAIRVWDPQFLRRGRTISAERQIATQGVAAINHSHGVERTLFDDDCLCGRSTLARSVDYQAFINSTINVIATPNTAMQARQKGLDVTYNAIKVRALEKDIAGVYRFTTLLDVQPVYNYGDRSFVELLAPGKDISVLPQATGAAPIPQTGTSFAAPHVTGAMALLHEYTVTNNLPADSRYPYVMKSVMLNSADKIQGRLPGPDPVNPAVAITMSRTVIDDNLRRWDQDPAADIRGAADAATRQQLALSHTMGAGALNVRRAVTQLKEGRYTPQNNPTGPIGWDKGNLNRQNDPVPANGTGLRNHHRFEKYTLPPLQPGSDFSATLSWQRQVLPFGFIIHPVLDVLNGFRAGDPGTPPWAETQHLPRNLDLYLVPQGGNINNAIWSSRSIRGNVEHMFVQLPPLQQNYELWVVGDMSWDADDAFQRTVPDTDYGLAWWGQPLARPAPGGSIGDRMWYDIDNNDVQSVGETGVPDAVVTLLDANTQEVIEQTRTDSNGNFIFMNLPPGDYQVQFEAPFGHTFVDPDVGPDTLDSDAIPDTLNEKIGLTGVITISSVEDRIDIDAGVEQKPLDSSVGDYVWRDTDGDGSQEFGEQGVANVEVSLFTASGEFLESQTTDSSGYYQFTNLAAEDYYLVFTAPSIVDNQFTLKDAGNEDTDSDVDSFGYTDVFSLGESESKTDIDAGLLPPTYGWIGDYVWDDENEDGIQDDTEYGIPDVKVSLYTSTGILVAETYTIGDGYYEFSDVIPGSYYLVFDAPYGYQFTLQDSGIDDTMDSDVDSLGQTVTFTVSAGSTDLTLDAGLNWELAAISDYVWDDVNRDGVQDEQESSLSDVTVNLLDGTGTLITSTTTDDSGNYAFDELEPGNYQVEFVAPAGYVFSPQNIGSDDELDSDADSSTGRTSMLSVVSGEYRTNVDAGLYQSGAAIGDYVWYDDNADGIQDEIDNGLIGITVNLLDELGTPIETTTTDDFGYYEFTGLAPGSYIVEFVAPNDFLISPKDQGTDETLDSDADPLTGWSDLLTLSQGSLITDVDAGIYHSGIGGSGQLSDFIWDDLDQDGIQDLGEPGLSDVTVNLLDDLGGWLDSTSTDSTGYYEFTDLVAGDYQLQIDLLSNYQFSPQDQGADDHLDSDADPMFGLISPITLSFGDERTDLDVGMYSSGISGGSIGNFVWEDLDQDGIQDPGEPGIPDVMVELYDEWGTYIDMQITDANGQYMFENLPDGEYDVFFYLPPDYTPTLVDVGSDDSVDNDFGPYGYEYITVTLSGGDDLTIDAGLVYDQPPGMTGFIGDFVFEDANQNGIQDIGEVGIAGVVIHLYDEFDVWIDSVTSDTNGYYVFESVLEGNYYLHFEKPTGYEFTLQDQGGDDMFDSDVDSAGYTALFTLLAGENRDDIDAGLYLPI